MDRAEAARQAQAIGEKVDAMISDVGHAQDINILISIMLGRAVGLCKMQQESGAQTRDDAMSYFATALVEATQPIEQENDDAEMDTPAVQ